MAKEPFEQFAMPKELRAFVEQSVTQAKHAFDGFMQAQAARGGANEIAHKSMAYAEKNMAATFEFAEKLMQAKDATEVMRLQSDYLGRQMQALSTQVQELGQSAAKMVVDAGKPPP
jgi:hypothetical protein